MMGVVNCSPLISVCINTCCFGKPNQFLGFSFDDFWNVPQRGRSKFIPDGLLFAVRVQT